jgi:hypothetical protein
MFISEKIILVSFFVVGDLHLQWRIGGRWCLILLSSIIFFFGNGSRKKECERGRRERGGGTSLPGYTEHKNHERTNVQGKNGNEKKGI